jgi:hypothetical protein
MPCPTCSNGFLCNVLPGNVSIPGNVSFLGNVSFPGNVTFLGVLSVESTRCRLYNSRTSVLDQLASPRYCRIYSLLVSQLSIPHRVGIPSRRFTCVFVAFVPPVHYCAKQLPAHPSSVSVPIHPATTAAYTSSTHLLPCSIRIHPSLTVVFKSLPGCRIPNFTKETTSTVFSILHHFTTLNQCCHQSPKISHGSTPIFFLASCIASLSTIVPTIPIEFYRTLVPQGTSAFGEGYSVGVNGRG